MMETLIASLWRLLEDAARRALDRLVFAAKTWLDIQRLPGYRPELTGEPR